MNTRNRIRLVYGLLGSVWMLVAAWQWAEHSRVRNSARQAVLNRSRDITSTLGLVIRSQRRFRGMVSQERLEPALTELVKSGEMSSVALFNAAGEVVASAGPPIDLDMVGILRDGVRWGRERVTAVNLVDLGAIDPSEGTASNPIIVLPKRPSEEEDGPGGSREEGRTRGREERGEPDLGGAPPPLPGETSQEGGRRPRDGRDGRDDGDRRGDGRDDDRNRERRRFGRPFWMDPEEYQALIERRGLHGLVISMSTATMRATCEQDLWMRLVVGCFAGVAVAGLGVAWRNLEKTSELQMRLIRASELNAHLKEMNLAAAGLAHETRNPLNIVRGLAQLISKQTDASSEIREKSRAIVEESDRVTAQLNEFINYSRPREVRRGPVALKQVIDEVVRALGHDLEEKRVTLEVGAELPTIEADEPLLRQVLFNLLLNSVQAVPLGGRIAVGAQRVAPGNVALTVSDDGPGVLPEHRGEIFKPYFTTRERGTGLGLAVVQQIVLAHGWDIEFQSNQPQGAVFRITHIAPLNGSPSHAA